MRHVSLRKIAFSICMIGAVLLLPLDLVYCVNPVIVISGTKEISEIDRLCTLVNENIKSDNVNRKADSGFARGLDKEETWEFLICNAENNSVEITIDMNAYRDLSAENQQKVMQITLTAIADKDLSNISRSTRNKIYNDICNLDEPTTALVRQLSEDTRADFAGAYSMFKPFSSPLGILMGCIALIMFIAIGFACIIDIAFINLPLVQNFLIKDNGKKPSIVSIEAYTAVMESDSKTNEYVSPNGIYLKRKSKQYILLFICLLYLCSGEIYSIIANIMDYFRGLVEVFN